MDNKFTAKDATNRFKEYNEFDDIELEEAFYQGASFIFEENPIDKLKVSALEYAKIYYDGDNGEYCNSILYMYQLGAQFMVNSLITLQDPRAYSVQVRPDFRELGQNKIIKVNIFK